MFKKRYVVLLLVLALGICVKAYPIPSFPLFDTFGSSLSDSPIAKIERSLKIIEREYYDPKRIHPREILESGMRAIAEKLPAVLVTFSDTDKRMKVEIEGESRTFYYANVTATMDVLPLFNQVFEWITEKQILAKERLDKDDLEYAICDAILSTLDPHSSVMTPELFKEFQTQTEGEFGGIGIVIGLRDGVITVISPLVGTPAWRARIGSGDKILKIDDEPSLNMPLNEAVNKLRGKVGSKVKLTLEHEGGEEYSVGLKREIIHIESVQSTLLTEKDKQIGYLRVKNFQGDTYDELLKHLQNLKSRIPDAGLDGLILDLRNNPGGLLDQAVEMADLFLADGPIVMTVKAGTEVEKVRMAHSPGTEPNYPIVVFVNEGSASASEIVAAALKDNGRALVVGERTFGKGSIQSIFDLGSEAAIKMTIAEYWTAGRRSIQSVGIVPHIRLFPVRMNKKMVDLIPNLNPGESDLEKHLESGQTGDDKPLFQLSYFDEQFFKKKDPELDEDEGPGSNSAFSEEARREYSKEAHVEGDYWIDFAKRIFSQENQNYLSYWRSFSAWLVDIQRQEEQRIANAFTELGIDWQKPENAPRAELSKNASPAASDAKPKSPVTTPLQLETILKQNGRVTSQLLAGQKAVIEVKATNLGKVPLYHILASTRSVHRYFIFDDREFAFGRINPGETVTARTEFKIPAAMPHFTEPIVYDIYSGMGNKIAEAKAYYSVSAAPKPQFSFFYTLTDRARDSSPLSGNGAVDPGEVIELALTVKNHGPGIGQEVQANLKNLSGTSITLEQGRTDLSLMKPGSEKKGILSFQVKPMTSERELSLTLLIADGKSGDALDTRLVFPLSIKETITPSPGKWHTPPRIIVSKILPSKPAAAGPLYFQVEGTVLDDEKLEDLQAFIGDDKQVLKTNPSADKTLPFSFALRYDPKKKDRFFYLLGRDHEGLMDREVYGIPLFDRP